MLYNNNTILNSLIMIKTKKNFGCVIEKELYWGNEILAKDVEELKKMGVGAVGNLIHYKDPKDEIKYLMTILLYFIYQLRISQQIQLNGVNRALNLLKIK